MDAATIAMACLWLALGQGPGGVSYWNARGAAIPADIDPASKNNIKELRLYATSDQGKSWQVVSAIDPSKETQFPFRAPDDGTYVFCVALVDQRSNQQDPATPGIGPAYLNMTMVIDTAKPIIDTVKAQRSGDEIQGSWRIREQHPDWSSLRLEYQVAGSPSWTPIRIQGDEAGVFSFNPGTTAPLTIRLSVSDRARNASTGFAQVDGTGTVAAAYTPTAAPEPSPSPAVPVAGTPAPSAPVAPASPGYPANTLQMPTTPAPVAPAPPSIPAPPSAAPAPPVTPVPAPSVVADTSWSAPQNPAPRDPRTPVDPGPAPQAPAAVQTVANVRKLPELRHWNERKVPFELEFSKVGRVELDEITMWCTKDEGLTWTKFTEDRQVKDIGSGKQLFTVELDDDGVYGFRIIAKNKFGRGKPPPVAGDLPEIRLELDTTKPEAKLFAPQPDPQRPETLLIRWAATDKNLDKTPVSLEWAERPDGKWNPIALDLSNQPAQYAWQPGKDIPVQVYLRIRVRDAAGNEGIAVTREPIPVDLSEPEVHLVGVAQPPRR